MAAPVIDAFSLLLRRDQTEQKRVETSCWPAPWSRGRHSEELVAYSDISTNDDLGEDAAGR